MARGINPKGPGLAVLVRMNGRIVYEGAAGMADRIRGVRITGKTTFELASASKPLTASAVLKLVEAGSINLDDSAKKWLPDLPHDWSAITVRDLLTHRSAIPDYMAGIAVRDAPRLLDGLTNEMLMARWRASPALLFIPGSRSQYSNSNFVLLAEIVAVASGRPFADYLAGDIFAISGMKDSYVDGSTRAGSFAALNYADVELTNGIRLHTEGPTGICSSVEDLSNWLAALLDGRLVSLNMLQQMTAPQSFGPVFEDGERYGYGWALPAVGDLRDTFAHAGQKDGFRSIIFVDRERNVDYVILSNGGEALVPATTEIRYLIQALLQQGSRQ